MPRNDHLPTDDELATLSDRELTHCIRQAFDDWNQALQKGEDIDEKKQIYGAYDREMLRRYERVKKYLKIRFD